MRALLKENNRILKRHFFITIWCALMLTLIAVSTVLDWRVNL